jgi:YD repeat-containing protein
VTNTYLNRVRTALALQQPAGLWTNGFLYDAAGRLTNVTSQAGAFGYTYDAVRAMLTKLLTLPNGSYITNTFDSVARTLETDLRKSDTTALDSYAYIYNLAGQRTNVTRADSSTVGYTYDKIGQLKVDTGSSSTDNRGYLYDAAWNINWVTNGGTAGQYTVNSLNELTSAPGFVGSQAYDGNGNLTNNHSGDWGYSYDAENRLVSSYRQPMVILDPPHVTQFFYDGFSRLRIRQEWEWVPSIQDSPVGIDAPSGGGGGDGYWQLDSETH